MSAPTKFDTLTVHNIINAYRSAYYSVHQQYPEQCEYVDHGLILVDGLERDRAWLIHEVERLRQVALEHAENGKQSSPANPKRGRLFKLIRMFSSGGEETESPPTTPCPHCNHPNALKANFCQKCGGRMALDDVKDELAAPQSVPARRVGVPVRERVFKSPDLLTNQAVVRLHVNGDVLHVPVKRNVFLGRDDSHHGMTSVVDLRPYGGYRMGVCHRHAEIFITDDHHFEISDLGSSNGTYLNGDMLTPLHSYRLQDGDLIQLGDLEVQIYLSSSPSPAF